MSSARKAFSLLELLVVILIMFVLVTIAVVAFSGVRAGANRTASLNALRQMATGFSNYANDHRGRFMPGYLDQTELSNLNIKAELPGGAKIDAADCAAGGCDASSWVWRLSPYLGNAWDTMFVDYRKPDLVERLATQFEGKTLAQAVYGPASASTGDLPTSEIPSFGMNTVFIGGDSAHGGAAVVDRNPWTPTDPDDVLAATRLTEVKNPARIILFGACMKAPAAPGPTGSEFDLTFGSPALMPPYLSFDPEGGQGSGTPQWEFGSGNNQNVIIANAGDYSAGGGWPVARAGSDLVPVAHLDGSVASENRFRLGADGSFWAPNVIGPARQQDTDGN